MKRPFPLIAFRLRTCWAASMSEHSSSLLNPLMMTSLPPLSTSPYIINSLAQYIHDFNLVDPVDGSSGGPSTLTTVQNSK